MPAPKAKIELTLGAVWRGQVAERIVVDGHDLTRLVRKVHVDADAGGLTVVSLELVKVQVVANVDGAFVEFAHDGWRALHRLTHAQLEVLEQLNRELGEARIAAGAQAEKESTG